ncbi:hypothetical protein ACJ41O_015117 [Fusarium nematophilum]
MKWSTKHETHPESQLSLRFQTGNPRKRRSSSKQQADYASTASTTSGLAGDPNPGGENWGLFSEFSFGGAASQNPQPRRDSQFNGTPDTLPSGDFPSELSLDLPVLDLQWSPDTFEPTDTVNTIAPAANTDLALLPAHHDLDFLFVPPTITSMPSSLVEFWFRDVCSLWSQYDSHMNFNRIIATTLWSSSEAVSVSLQCMSSAYLSSKIPQMKQTCASMMKTATRVIESELQVVKASENLHVLPMGLIYALFCVGTSICWLNATQLGIPFLREAKALLYRVNRQKRNLSDEERNLLHFFNKSWTYCELLLAMAAYNGPFSPYEIDNVEDVGAEDSPTAEPVQPDIDDAPHPWTGVSNTASRLFTQTLKLCRKYRYALRRQTPPTTSTPTIAPKLMEDVKVLEERFLSLDFETTTPESETGDQKTPCQHLVNVAESYRLAGLIHIYQTFPDLVTLRLGTSASNGGNARVPWEEIITPLSLRLVKLIEQLPPDSGSKMTQPLLCITASTGLRFESPEGTSGLPAAPADDPGSVEDCGMSDYIAHLIQAEQNADLLAPVTESHLKIVNARSFITDRLDALETLLPPPPIVVAKKLVRTIWNVYDNEQPGVGSAHWIDIMERHNLRSLFG